MDQYLPKRRPRSVNWLEEDKKLLTVLVCEKIEIIENKSTKINVNIKKASAWDEILHRFNAKCKGVTRTTDQMKIQWKQLKIIARNKNPDFYEQIKNGCITALPLTYKNAQAVADGVESTLESESKSDSSSEENTLAFIKSRKPKWKSYYIDIHNCCVALIREHGRPAELLDDLAFRKILTKVPMRDVERSKLTSAFIKECIDDDELWSSEGSEEDDASDDDHDFDDKTDDGEMNSDNSPLKSKVKKEKVECSCSSRHMGFHMIGCAAIGQDTYSNNLSIKTEPKEHTNKANENFKASVELNNTRSNLIHPPNKILKLTHNKQKIDAFDAFGKSVAMQLKSLSESSALLAQSQIQTTLTECGMADIKNKKHNRSNCRNSTSKSNIYDDDSVNGTNESVSRSYLKYKFSSK